MVQDPEITFCGDIDAERCPVGKRGAFEAYCQALLRSAPFGGDREGEIVCIHGVTEDDPTLRGGGKKLSYPFHIGREIEVHDPVYRHFIIIPYEHPPVLHRPFIGGDVQRVGEGAQRGAGIELCEVHRDGVVGTFLEGAVLGYELKKSGGEELGLALDLGGQGNGFCRKGLLRGSYSLGEFHPDGGLASGDGTAESLDHLYALG